MINPADLNLSALPWVPLDATAGLPAQPGIYFAIDSLDQIQYIGRSGDVRSRWKRHHRYEDLVAIGGVRIVYLFIDAPELLPEIEAALIEWFSPLLNRQAKQYKAKGAIAPLATDKPKISVYMESELLKWFQDYCRVQKRSISAQVNFMVEALKSEEESK